MAQERPFLVVGESFRRAGGRANAVLAPGGLGSRKQTSQTRPGVDDLLSVDGST